MDAPMTLGCAMLLIAPLLIAACGPHEVPVAALAPRAASEPPAGRLTGVWAFLISGDSI
jgi:hypothetical protein